MYSPILLAKPSTVKLKDDRWILSGALFNGSTTAPHVVAMSDCVAPYECLVELSLPEIMYFTACLHSGSLIPFEPDEPIRFRFSNPSSNTGVSHSRLSTHSQNNDSLS
ncbi:hypothetical protein PCANC_04044 [Puccinia coronata f. sp. avenae]|uniref:Uncharacterized protein n=1 Tax=Puccinia coronata f. sp. avenae TaxID=200324 RepID=A0A2N5W281_9BASI|nr:hypothetical protein PCANC_04044 [Puccinia coronata f. sp. avenae]